MSIFQFEELAVLPNRELEVLCSSSSATPPENLSGYEWRGYNISPVIRFLGIQKFIKGFFSLDARVEGYNIQVEQNGLLGAWLHRPSAEAPKRYAYFDVKRVNPASRDNLYAQALLLNYGTNPRNPRSGIERNLRDYLVQPDPNNTNLLLGKAYLALGSWRVFSNFFIIERLRSTNWVP